MASRFTELVVDSGDPHRIARFWAAVLDYKISEEDEESSAIEPPDGSRPLILFFKVPEGKTVKNRLHIDVNPLDRNQQEEVERLLELGATKIDIGQGEQSWVVMADPEGNEFCVLRTRVS